MLIAAFKALHQCYRLSTRVYSVPQRDDVGRTLLQIHRCQVLIYSTWQGSSLHLHLTGQVDRERAVFRAAAAVWQASPHFGQVINLSFERDFECVFIHGYMYQL